MKFMIDRASAVGSETKPCDGAIQLEGGGYGIKLRTLGDLMDLVDEVGCPIIVSPGKGLLARLQIYDDFIE